MGVATHPRDGYSATTLIAAADVALYDAKDLGGNQFATGTATRGALAEAGGRLVRPVGRGRGAARGRGADRDGSGAVRGGLTGYGSTRTPVAISTGGHPCPDGRSVPCLGPRVRNRVPSFGDLWERIDLRALGRRPFLVLLVALASIEIARLFLDPHPIDLLVLGLIGLCGIAAVREQEAAGIEGTRRNEAESFARILRGLARSVSPDAIVDAIVEELGVATGADHVAVVRRRPEGRSLEALLSPTRPGAPTSRTSLPLSELEDPAEDEALSELAVAAARGRRLTAVPIEPDPDGDPQLVPLGIAADRLAVVGAGSGREGLGLDRNGGPTTYATMPPAGWSRGRHAVPAREGADQRIADRIADRLRAAYGLANVVAAPLRVNGRVEGAIVLSRRTRVPWPRLREPDPGGRGGRGVRRARPRLLAARRGGPRHDRRPHRPARTAATSTSTWGCWPSAAGPRTRSAC